MDVQTWGETFLKIAKELWGAVAAFLPKFLAAIIIVFIGFIISKIFNKLCTALLKKIGLDKVSEKIGINGLLEKTGSGITVSEIVGKFIFWFFMLTFLMTGAETLGLSKISQTLDSFVAFLPKVLTSAMMAVVGMMVAQFIRDFIRTAAEGIGIEYGKPLSNMAYGILMVIIIILAIGQLEVETALLNRVVEIILMATAVALAISLGLGTRNISRNIVSGVYAREILEAGKRVVIDDKEGVLEEVGTVASRVKLDSGEVLQLPNAEIIASRILVK